MTVLLFVLQLLPLLLTTVQQIEASVQAAKAGPAKLHLLMGVVNTALKADASKTIPVNQDQLIAMIGSMTTDIVNFYNATGLFKKSS